MELEAIEEKERERIDAIRDENLCMKVSPSDGKNVTSGVLATPVKSPVKFPVKSPVTMKVIMTPKKPLTSPRVPSPVITPPKVHVSKIQTPIVSSPVPLGTSTPSESIPDPKNPVAITVPEHAVPSTPSNNSVISTPTKTAIPVPAATTPSKNDVSIPSVPVPSTPTKDTTPVRSAPTLLVSTSTPPKNTPPVPLSVPTAATLPVSTSTVHLPTDPSPHEIQPPRETERSMARISYEDKIQSKTQELLQRVEDMKKRTEASKRRKEEKLQQSFLSTPSKLETSFHQSHPLTTPHLGVASRVLTDLAALTVVKETTLDVDLNMPALNVSELPTERSFVSIVSSPTAKKRKLMKTSSGSLKAHPVTTSPPRSHPFSSVLPVTTTPQESVSKQIPALSQPSPVQLPTQTLPSQVSTKPQPSPSQPQSTSQPQSSSLQPQSSSLQLQPSSQSQPSPSQLQSTPSQPQASSQSQPSLPEEESKQRPLPLGPRRVPVTATQLPISVKREMESPTDSSSSKPPVTEPPRLPSNLPTVPRPEQPRSDVSNTPKPRNLEVLQKLVLSEHEDPSLHWYEGDNLALLVRRQYYESFCSVEPDSAVEF